MFNNSRFEWAFVVLAIFAGPAGEPMIGRAGDGKSHTATSSKIRIAKETTYFLKPVRKDGSIDYAAALNARARRGVTPANNAAALIIQVCSREDFSDADLKRYYKELGVPHPARERIRMLSMKEFARFIWGAKHKVYVKQLHDEHKKATSGPWA